MALKYQRAFTSLHLVDENYKYCLSEEKWKRVKKKYVFLLPFYVITNIISTSNCPTLNLYFLKVWNMKDEDQVIEDITKRMMVKFDKY